MELKIVNLKQAKALSELGFPRGEQDYFRYFYVVNTHKSYNEYVGEIELNENCLIDTSCEDVWLEYENIVSAPTLELVAKWLREEKNIHITPQYKTLGDKVIYYSKINAHYLEEKESLKRIIFESWEEALSAGIDKAIEILTKKK